MRFKDTNANPESDTGRAESVQIGEFTISNFGDDGVWIEDGDADAGSFSEAALVAAIRKFYGENF